jgi:hypothetical protein
MSNPDRGGRSESPARWSIQLCVWRGSFLGLEMAHG